MCDAVEHDDSSAPIVDCLVYYVTAYVTKQIFKHTKFEVCKNNWISTPNYSGPVSELTLKNQ